MNSTKIESPGNQEHFFIFGSPPLDSAQSYNYCRETRRNGSCHEQHRNVNRMVDTHRHFKQENAASSNDWVTTAVNEKSHDEILEESIPNKTASHLFKVGFLKRKNADQLSKQLDGSMSFKCERDEFEKETLDLILGTLRKAECYNVTCLFCERPSPVYDDFPVVDGTLFASPVQLSQRGIPLPKHTKETTNKFMEFICVGCLTGKSSLIRCTACQQRWGGDCFQLGTLYSYNILSSMPCCSRHVDCKKCHKTIIDPSSDAYFSFYSNKITCPHCQVEDFHFIKSPILFGK